MHTLGELPPTPSAASETAQVDRFIRKRIGVRLWNKRSTSGRLKPALLASFLGKAMRGNCAGGVLSRRTASCQEYFLLDHECEKSMKK